MSKVEPLDFKIPIIIALAVVVIALLAVTSALSTRVCETKEIEQDWSFECIRGCTMISSSENYVRVYVNDDCEAEQNE